MVAPRPELDADSMMERAMMIELLRNQQQNGNANKGADSFLNGKNVNSLIIAAIIGAVAWLWTGVTEQPLKNADSFSTIAQQNAETKATLGQLTSSVNNLNVKFDRVQQQAADTASQVERNKAELAAAQQRLDRLESGR